jgi:hypothetical protein
MSDDDNTAQIVKDLRLQHGYPDDMPQSEIFNREAIKYSFLDPQARAIAIRALENSVNNYDNARPNIRCRAQGFRLLQTVRTAHERLKRAGR